MKIVFFCKKLQEQKEFVLSKQLLKSGTSIGANIEEANQAQSKSDFISKLCISLKEGQETQFWLRLLRDTQYADSHACEILLGELKEILALLTSIIKTTKKNLP